MTKTAEDANKWKGIPCSQTGRILLKCSVYSKQSTDAMQFLSMAFFIEIEKQS